jgi:Cof subfamily protein (haloacid dehalogenase superfamily)
LTRHKNVQLAALDLDGTLLNPEKKISAEDEQTIREALSAGREIVIASGRPYFGLPLRKIAQMGIRYAITVNGAAVYTIPDMKCLYQDPMPKEAALTVMEHLEDAEVYCDVFIDGRGYGSRSKRALLDQLPLPEPMRRYKKETRTFVDDLPAAVGAMGRPVQKLTLDFVRRDGQMLQRRETEQYLQQMSELCVVSGGGGNLEVTGTGTSKGKALKVLADRLQIPVCDTLACGDSGNDLDLIKTAGVGVAMANADREVLAEADFITKSNAESGVAYALRRFMEF